MIGFKAFAKGLIAKNNFKYEIGKEYEIDGELKMCKNGFHFSIFPLDVDKWYMISESCCDIEYGIVEALGDILHNDFMSVTNKIKIIKQITREELMEYVKDGEYILPNGDLYRIKNKNFHNDGDLPALELARGIKKWYIDGRLHRDGDLPAIEFAKGGKYWCLNGRLHRDDDKPAIECANGGKYWYIDGQKHRDGNKPAIECANGNKYWYIRNEPQNHLVYINIQK
jgi:hypothetical protein